MPQDQRLTKLNELKNNSAYNLVSPLVKNGVLQTLKVSTETADTALFSQAQIVQALRYLIAQDKKNRLYKHELAQELSYLTTQDEENGIPKHNNKTPVSQKQPTQAELSLAYSYAAFSPHAPSHSACSMCGRIAVSPCAEKKAQTETFIREAIKIYSTTTEAIHIELAKTNTKIRDTLLAKDTLRSAPQKNYGSFGKIFKPLFRHSAVMPSLPVSDIPNPG